MNVKKIIIGIITFLICVLSFYGIKNNVFYSDEYIEIMPYANPNIDSLGDEIIISNISFDNVPIELGSLQNSSWILSNNKLVYVGNFEDDISDELIVNVPDNAKMLVNMTKYNYGGQVKIDNKLIDLYSENVTSESFSYVSQHKTPIHQLVFLFLLLTVYIVTIVITINKNVKFWPVIIIWAIFYLLTLFGIKSLESTVLIIWPSVFIFLVYYFNKKYVDIFSVIIPFLLFLITKNFIEPLNFSFNNDSSNIGMYLTSMFTMVILYILFITIKSLWCKIFVEKNEKVKSWVKYSLIILLINFAFLLLIWPGNWIWDEKGLLIAAQNYYFNTWQSYTTVLFYAVSLMILPFVVGIVFLQTIVISFITGYIFSNISQIIKNKKLIIIMFLLLLLPPIALNNLYPLRSSILIYVEILLLFITLKDVIFLKTVNFKKLFVIFFLLMVVTFWRSENIYYIFLYPCLILILYFIEYRRIKLLLNILALLLGSFLVTCPMLYLKNYSSVSYSSDLYAITTFVNPLSNMFDGDYIISQEDYDNINNVLDIEVLKQNVSFIESPTLWNGGLQPEYYNHLDEFKKSYIRFILDNPKLFIESRFKTFLATSGFYKEYPNNSPWGIYDEIWHEIVDVVDENGNREIQNMVYNDALSQPINHELRLNVIHFLKGVEGINDDSFTLFGQIVWNFVPSLVILIITIIGLLFKKRFAIACLLLLPLIKVPLIFATAPANYFFYYLSIYVIGIFLLGYGIIKLLDKRSMNYEKK